MNSGARNDQPAAAGPDHLRAEAVAFLDQCAVESRRPLAADRRAQVLADIAATGTYTHSDTELSFGTKIAWRNTARCVGKFYWKGLSVVDMRHLDTEEDIAEALIQHLRTATNGGRIRLLLTVFRSSEPGRPGPRIWNPQLVRYAGYRLHDGTVIGDRAMVRFTEWARRLGWAGARGTRFDVLPLIVQQPGSAPRVFDLPPDAVLEVPLTHPDHPRFADLGLRWYAFPSISDQRLEIGGVSYPAAPFSAWYTCAEVGARNLSDTDRYDMLPQVAELLGLDTTSDRSLWRDRAMVELTAAVMHSYAEAGVTMVDHHFVSHQFVQHELREQAQGRHTPARWDLMIPPIGAAATPLWSRRYDPTETTPNFFPRQETECPFGPTGVDQTIPRSIF